MKRAWIVLTFSIIILITAFIFFIFPGYYFTFESKKAESTTSMTGPLPPSPSDFPSFSTGAPTPSGSYPGPSYSSSGSANPSASQSGSSGPSSSVSGSISPSGSSDGFFNKFYNKEARENEVKTLSASIASPIIGVTAVAAVAAFVLNPLLSLLFNFPFRDFFYFFFSSFLEFLGIRKRRRPWGVVYESSGKKPIAGAIVKIIEADSNRVKETRITDNEGRFGFLVEKGEYILKVIKNGFSFPSTKINLDPKGSDGYYPQVYLGDKIKIKKGFIGLNIPLDMLAEEQTHGYLLFLRIVRFFEHLRLPILILGTILALVNFYLFRSVVDLLIIIVYLLLWAFEFWNLRKIKPYGEVKNEMAQPLDLTVMRFFRVDDSRLVTTVISDSRGRFYVLLPEGKFYFTVMKGGYLPYKSQDINVSRIQGSPEIKVILKKAT